ncbi:MAG: hypothetical protein HUU37_07030 [Bdellovibrionales bacterium]|nr:hypothetical protein [Bdellovibrionales bacterium]
MIRRLAPLALCLIATGTGADTWTEAERLLREKKPAEAVRLMEETLKSAAPSATQLYNLGTALAHAGEYARAHGMLLTACDAWIFNDDCRNNLDFVRGRLGEAASFRPSNGVPALADVTVSPEVLWSLALAALAVVLGLHALGKHPGWPAWGAWVAVFLFAGAVHWEKAAPRGVVAQGLPLRTGPAESFAETAALPAGAWVAVEERREGWLKISFRGGAEKRNQAGWIPSSALISTGR